MTAFGAVTGLIAAAVVAMGWGFVFEQLGTEHFEIDMWLYGALAALLFGALVGAGCALPVWTSDDVSAGRQGGGLPAIALVLGALAAMAGDVAAMALGAPGTVVDLASALVFAQQRGGLEWVLTFIAAGAAAATCHRAIEGKRRGR
ncbi:MAG: hypothetical protein M3Y87_29245 [Myxococcota bacterium]|nr:hypothetical protein [Myxococcota bacterium]